MISKKFIKSSFIYTIAGALPMASMVILWPFYMFYLPIEEFGAMAIFTTFSGLVQVIITFSFDSSLYIYYHEYKKDHTALSVFVSSTFVFITLTGIAATAILVMTGSLLFSALYDNPILSFYPFGFLSVITAVFQAYFKVYSGLLQSREKPELFFWSNLLSFSLIAGLTVGGLVLFPNTLIGPVGGRMAAAVISGSWVLIKVAKEFGFHFNFPMLKTTFAYNNSSYIYQVQQWVITNFDRQLMMFFHLPLSAVGTYDFAYKCMLMIDFVINGLQNSFYPKVIGIVMEQEKKESSITINRYYHGLIAMMMLLVCLSILGYPLLFDSGVIPAKFDGYKDSLKYLPFLGLIYLVKSIRYYFVFPYGALKYTKPLPVIYLIVSVIKVALMVLFITRFSVYAVIGSTLVSSMVEIILLRLLIRNKFDFRFNAFKLIIAPLLLGAVLFLAEALAGGIQEHIRHGFYVVFCGVMLIWIYRNELRLIKPFGFIK